MNIDQQQLTQLVTQIVARMENDIPANSSRIFQTVDSAVSAARQAQRNLVMMTLHERQRLIEAMHHEILHKAETLAEMAVKQTGMGNVADKVTKLQLAAKNIPGLEDLKASASTGDAGLTLNEYSPYGVVSALISCRFALETIIGNALSAVAAGNAVIFYPYHAAVGICEQVISCLESAMHRVGAPAHLLSMVKHEGPERMRALILHPDVDMVVACGGNALAEFAMSCGKKAIATGSSHTPVVVDETANIAQAAKDIIAGVSFDHNMSGCAEKVIVAVEDIADYLKHHLIMAGGYMVESEEEAMRLTDLLIDTTTQKPKIDYRAQPASALLKALGKQQPAAAIIMEVNEGHPLLKVDAVAPVIPLVRVKDVNAAINLACDVEQGNRHTAIMHSKHIDHLTLCARALQTVVFIKNAPSYAAIGLGGEGFTSYAIAARTGEGPTSARHFSRSRRCVLSEGFLIK